MRRKIRLTRPELKRQRDMLGRFERYLPMLKLKQQLLQMTIQQLTRKRNEIAEKCNQIRQQIDEYRQIFHTIAGINVEQLTRPTKVSTHRENIAGVWIPVFETVTFAPADYSLFGTPPWVDKAIADLRKLNETQALLDVLQEQHTILSKALTKVIQRVNLFEKVLIPRCRENIRIIRIHLGEEQTAAVARAKLAKAKLLSQQEASRLPRELSRAGTTTKTTWKEQRK